MPENLVLVLWFWAILGALVGAAIGQRKGRAGAAFVFGLILGPIYLERAWRAPGMRFESGG